MSKSNIPDKIQKRLWAQSGGRCEFPGCNKILYRDELTRNEYNISYIGHIVADSPKGPRGDEILSPEMATDLNNLMLLCDEHHRLIDGDHKEKYPVELLLKYKKQHEERIETLTSISEEMKTHILMYGANIGVQSSPLSEKKVLPAIAENGFYPAAGEVIEMSLKNSVFTDDMDDYWKLEKKNLEELYIQKVRFQIKDGLFSHLSVFGIAPQPLLVYLGHLLSDIPTAELYQLHRSPPNWIWKKKSQSGNCCLEASDKSGKDIALAISLSQNVDPRKIYEILGEDIPVWSISVSDPNSEYLKTKEQLNDFRVTYKRALDQIKLINGDQARIHLFPASPIPVAIEMGRARFQKVDLPMTIYDYNKKRGGFIKALEIE